MFGEATAQSRCQTLLCIALTSNWKNQFLEVKVHGPHAAPHSCSDVNDSYSVILCTSLLPLILLLGTLRKPFQSSNLNSETVFGSLNRGNACTYTYVVLRYGLIIFTVFSNSTFCDNAKYSGTRVYSTSISPIQWSETRFWGQTVYVAVYGLHRLFKSVADKNPQNIEPHQGVSDKDATTGGRTPQIWMDQSNFFDEECDYRYVTHCSARNWVYHPYFVLYNNLYIDQGIGPQLWKLSCAPAGVVRTAKSKPQNTRYNDRPTICTSQTFSDPCIV